ncbi:hypothetical protein ILUMI_14607 [Ignelater luminosus]|uniref:DDE-1 domain-containing protein n=1 Tax=Ignelater luminosus TaxID=2038154 RepID=A0A8K0CUL7_IGNLU|nr:hypothetical protein ILUMI_14607 [Ignelater luminosus]
MLKGALPEAMGLATFSGWMNSELFEKVLERFTTQQKYERQPQFTNLRQPRELHFHQRSKKSTRKAAVQILTLPPHGSNLLQPLDVSVFGPVPFTICNISEFIAQAFEKAFTATNVLSRFKETGIHPFNPNAFGDADFLSFAVTDRLGNVPSDGPSEEPVLINRPEKNDDVTLFHFWHMTLPRTPSEKEDTFDSTSEDKNIAYEELVT